MKKPLQTQLTGTPPINLFSMKQEFITLFRIIHFPKVGLMWTMWNQCVICLHYGTSIMEQESTCCFFLFFLYIQHCFFFFSRGPPFCCLSAHSGGLSHTLKHETQMFFLNLSPPFFVDWSTPAKGSMMGGNTTDIHFLSWHTILSGVCLETMRIHSVFFTDYIVDISALWNNNFYVRVREHLLWEKSSWWFKNAVRHFLIWPFCYVISQ